MKYKERDIVKLDKEGNFYCKHVEAMTKEGLHEKSDIAAELAYRDWVIFKLKGALSIIEEAQLPGGGYYPNIQGVAKSVRELVEAEYIGVKDMPLKCSIIVADPNCIKCNGIGTISTIGIGEYDEWEDVVLCECAKEEIVTEDE